MKGIRLLCEYYGGKPRDVVEAPKGLSQDELVGEFSEFFVWAKDRVAPRSMWTWLTGIKAWLLENGVRDIES